MSLTPAQNEAIGARGNVLLVAGAGTGKTHTLVERCLHCLLEERPPASLDEILMVTFTEAAAAEMRQRIRARVEEELRKDPENPRWQEQLALFETAHIGTLHSFCLELIRQHFYQLELDPQLSVLAEEEARLLADETLEAILQKHYAGNARTAQAVQELIQIQGGGRDQLIRTLVLRLHRYTQTLPAPAGWLREQLQMFASPAPVAWQAWLLGGLRDWRVQWFPVLEQAQAQNQLARACVAALASVPAKPSRAQAAAVLRTLSLARQDCPHGKRTAWLKPLADFFAEVDFLLSLAPRSADADPLAEDWGWVRSQMTTLLELTREFTEAFTEAKRELGMVDFHDLEQYALRLLWDPATRQPTKIARHWRDQLRFVFVDEYQDINAAQDKIIEALSRDGAEANRFLVGDVKQSIYRFRLANPHIFQGYANTWREDQGRAIPLVENFRSREGLLHFINSLFAQIMRPELGGVCYDEQTQLRFGAPQERRALTVRAEPDPRVELHLRVKGEPNAQDWDEEMAQAMASVVDMEEADKEARLVALRLKELKAQQHSVWDEEAKAFRPVEWRDMAILLRSPSNKSESYAKEFARLGVPLLVARGGFYRSMEVSDLLSLLQLLDNPLQDIPAIAVLHSPLAGLTLNELATIRLTVKGHFWIALLRWQEAQSLRAEGEGDPKKKTEDRKPKTESGNRESGAGEIYRKVTTFLEQYARWRRLARHVSLTRCLEAVLAETHYASWLRTQPRGEQRHANVQRLLALAQQFDQFQRQSLFRFLKFIEAQQTAETEPQVAAVSEENSVRLMSIHQSKGLEFPVVVVADLGKPFNTADLRAEVILDEVYGLCPQVKPPHTGKRYPSLPYWLARQRQHRELLGEELRLLYVAMTRARDTLILSGSIPQAKLARLSGKDASLPPGEGKGRGTASSLDSRRPAPARGSSLSSPGGEEALSALVLSARNYCDWIACWFARNFRTSDPTATPQGANAFMRWVLHDDTRLVESATDEATGDEALEPLVLPDATQWQRLKERLAFTYPFMAATSRPAKTSVTLLRRRAAEQVDEADVSPFAKPILPFKLELSPAGAREGLSAAEIGTAHHTFLQFVAFSRLGSLEDLRQEARRLELEQILTAEEAVALDFEALVAFWNSDLGRRIQGQAQHVHRELAFTARFSPNELLELTGESPDPRLNEEFAVVQGVADLAVLLPKEIWVVDFKTDAVKSEDIPEKLRVYGPQLQLYARALSGIYHRPVSNAWLYFLSCRQAAAVPTPATHGHK